MSDFANNSAAAAPAIGTPLLINMIIGMMVIAGAIMLHSYSIHGRKWPSSRVQTDLASFCTLLSGVMVLVSLQNSDNATTWAVAYDFWYNGILDLIVQLCDNYMFLSRFCAIAKVPRWKIIAINVYLWSFSVLTWFPSYTIIPFFYNTNNDEYINVLTYTLLFDVYGIVTYNLYFTFEFARVLYGQYGRVGNSDHPSNQRIRIIALKSIGHCLTSSTATLIYFYIPVYGVPIYSIMIIVGMHVWFNCRVQKYVYCMYYSIYLCCCPRSMRQKQAGNKVPNDYLSDDHAIMPETLDAPSAPISNRPGSDLRGGSNPGTNNHSAQPPQFAEVNPPMMSKAGGRPK